VHYFVPAFTHVAGPRFRYRALAVALGVVVEIVRDRCRQGLIHADKYKNTGLKVVIGSGKKLTELGKTAFISPSRVPVSPLLTAGLREICKKYCE
jgi:hypothetical protein